MQLTDLALCAALASAACAWSPTNGYAPGNVTCPDVDRLVRTANAISDDEAQWVAARHEQARSTIVEWFERANLSTSFSASDFFSNYNLSYGLAFSGGGYRAMLSGAGMLSALDSRTANATNDGHVGGLLQGATYLAGLSGGSWLVGSIVMNNYTSVQALLDSDDVWDFEHSMINPGGLNIFETASYWDDIVDDIESKEDAGFNTSLTDIWGRGLAHQLVNTSDHGAALLWSDIRDYAGFANHEMPFPVVVADGRAPNTTIISSNSTVFEINPFELGSWDPSLYAFTDLKYLGTNVSNGVPTGDQCISGFDNGGYTIGTSATLFNQFILQLNSTGVSGVLLELAQSILEDLGEDSDDIAVYEPNPFYNITESSSSITKDIVLDLVDGGEDNQNVPLYPLIQPARALDAVMAFDNSADTDFNWANGSSLVWTYQRQFDSQGNGTIFPYVPDTQTFVNLNLTRRPTFFGCDASNLTSLFNESLPEEDRFIPPLIIYVANYPHSYYSNTSTFKMSYDSDEVYGMINNGYNIVTQDNGTAEADWHQCLACGLIKRELDRQNASYPDPCQSCYDKYCWDGSIDNSQLSTEELEPTTSVQSPASHLLPSISAAVVALTAVVSLVF